jgi:hypothetical protein
MSPNFHVPEVAPILTVLLLYSSLHVSPAGQSPSTAHLVLTVLEQNFAIQVPGAVQLAFVVHEVPKEFEQNFVVTSTPRTNPISFAAAAELGA